MANPADRTHISRPQERFFEVFYVKFLYVIGEKRLHGVEADNGKELGTPQRVKVSLPRDFHGV